jgi:hypothetical protein
MAEKRKMVTHKAITIFCGDCDFMYKTSNLDTTQCIECESSNIEIDRKPVTITHNTLLGDVDDGE